MSTEANRQKQMMRLIQRYASLIMLPNTWVLPYSWNVAWVDLDQPEKERELQYEEFICNTNNIVFAAMIFEAQKLPQKVTIAYIEFNNLVTHGSYDSETILREDLE